MRGEREENGLRRAKDISFPSQLKNGVTLCGANKDTPGYCSKIGCHCFIF